MRFYTKIFLTKTNLLIRQFLNTFDKKINRSLVKLFFLLFISVVLEVLGIGFIYPLIIVVLNPDKSNFLNDFFFELNFGVYNDVPLIMFSFVGILFFLRTIFLLIINSSKYKILSKINVFIVKKLYEKYMSYQLLKFKEKDSSYYITNINAEVNHIVIYLNSIITLIIEISLSLFIMITISVIQPLGSILSFSTLLILLFAFHFFIKNKVKLLGDKREILFKQFNFKLIESFKAFDVIKAYAKEETFISILNNLSIEENHIKAKSNTLKETPRYFVELSAIMTIILFIIILKLLSVDNIEILSFLGVLAVGIFRILPSANKVLVSLNNLKFYSKPTKKIINELSKKENFKNKTTNEFNSLELKNVSFSFHENVVLESINLKINKGDKIGINGESGSGKTTLISLILGFYSPLEGERIINKKIVNKGLLPISFSYLNQDTFIFNESVSFNITLDINKNVNRLRLIDCLQRVKLFDKIMSLPLKENTKLGELGNTLSGGQKQRLALARALYQKSELLILDEPSSSLDESTTIKIFQDLLIDENLTIILITHDKTISNLINKEYLLSNKSLKQII